MLKKEYKLMMIEKSVLREVFGTEGKEITGDWRKYHNEENLFTSCKMIHE
jgi:hypothetical protein